MVDYLEMLLDCITLVKANYKNYTRVKNKVLTEIENDSMIIHNQDEIINGSKGVLYKGFPIEIMFTPYIDTHMDLSRQIFKHINRINKKQHCTAGLENPTISLKHLYGKNVVLQGDSVVKLCKYIEEIINAGRNQFVYNDIESGQYMIYKKTYKSIKPIYFVKVWLIESQYKVRQAVRGIENLDRVFKDNLIIEHNNAYYINVDILIEITLFYIFECELIITECKELDVNLSSLSDGNKSIVEY